MHELYKSGFCKVCNASFSKEFVFREMMLGFRDEFTYYECSSCGCLQIGEFPEDIERYYPSYYYSFTQDTPKLKRQPLIKRKFSNLLINRKYRNANDALLSYFQPIKTLVSHKILDIGCGKGSLICKLFNKGFEHVQGIDKFIPEDIDYGYGVRVMKKDLSEISDDSYDLLMMHHVLEHMDHQHKELKECYRILKSNCYLIIRIPIKAFAWEKYKSNWVQLDAPRHFFIHSLKSINILAQENGFEIRDVVFDSTGFQFWGSELYIRDIPLFIPGTSNFFPLKDLFSKKVLKSYETEATKLNETHQGDQAIFYLYKN